MAKQSTDHGSPATALLSDRYGFQTGYFLGADVSITISGPQESAQVPDGVKQIFADAKLPVQFVMIVYEGVTGADKVDCYNRIEARPVPVRTCEHPWHDNPGLTTPCPSCGVDG